MHRASLRGWLEPGQGRSKTSGDSEIQAAFQCRRDRDFPLALTHLNPLFAALPPFPVTVYNDPIHLMVPRIGARTVACGE